MSDGFEWGPSVEHDGRSVPVRLGQYVHVLFEDGDEWEGIEGEIGMTKYGNWCLPDDGKPWSWIWDHPESRYGDAIIRYRIRRPRAVEDLARLCADPYALPPVIGPDSPVRQPERVPG